MLLVELLGSAHHELVLLGDADVVEGLRVRVVPHRTVIHRRGPVWLHNDGAILLLLAISRLRHLVLGSLGRVVPRLREDARSLRDLLGRILEDLGEVVVVRVAILGQHGLEQVVRAIRRALLGALDGALNHGAPEVLQALPTLHGVLEDEVLRVGCLKGQLLDRALTPGEGLHFFVYISIVSKARRHFASTAIFRGELMM